MEREKLIKELYETADRYSGRMTELLLMAAAEIQRPKEQYNMYCFKVHGEARKIGFVKEDIPIDVVKKAIFNTGEKGFSSYIENCYFIGKSVSMEVNYLNTMRIAWDQVSMILNY